MSSLGRSGAGLSTALTEAFSPEDLEMFTIQQLDFDLKLITNGPLKIAAGRLVQWAEQNGCVQNLLNALKTARPRHSNLMAQVANCEQTLKLTGPSSWYAEPDPLEACILRGRTTLFNRHQLRTHVREMLSSDGRNVLIIRGPAKSGRSHSAEYVAHVRSRLQTFLTAVVDLRRFPADAEPHAIVDCMVEQLWITQEQHWPDEQAARSNQRLVSSFIGRVENSEKPAWIVVDGFEHMCARPEILELFDEFAEQAEQSLKLRLILVGWDEPLSPTLESAVLHEEIEPMKPAVLHEFFSQLLRDQGQPPSPDGVQYAVECLEQQVGDDLVTNLGAIAAQAFTIAKSMAEPVRA